MRARPAGFVAAGIVAASLITSPVGADDPVAYVITYDPTILAGTDSSGTLTGVEGFGSIEILLEGSCMRANFYRRVHLVLVGEEPVTIDTHESFNEWPEANDGLWGGNANISLERPMRALDSPVVTMDLFGLYGVRSTRDDTRGYMRIRMRDAAGKALMSDETPDSFGIPGDSVWPLEAYWRIVEALRAGETEISFPLGPFGMPGILPPLEDDDGIVTASVIDWPAEAGSFAPPDDEIFSGRHWAVRIEVDHSRQAPHGPTHWVVELYESGAPGRFIYDFGYVQILMQPAIVEREPADNC